MKISCGTDIIEIERVKCSIESDVGDKFVERIIVFGSIFLSKNFPSFLSLLKYNIVF